MANTMQGLRIRLAPQAPSPIHQAIDFPFELSSLQTGLESLNMMGGGVNQSARNLAKNTTRGPATPYGTPVVNDYWMGLKTGSAWYELPFGDFESTTLMVVARSTDTNAAAATQPVFLGTSDGTSSGASLYVGSSSADRTIAYYASGSASASNNPGAGLTGWSMLVGRIGPTGTKTKNMADNDEGTGANPGGARVLGNRLKIGGGQGSSFAGMSDIAFAAVWSREISDAEATAAYNQVKAFYALRGITI